MDKRSNDVTKGFRTEDVPNIDCKKNLNLDVFELNVEVTCDLTVTVKLILIYF